MFDEHLTWVPHVNLVISNLKRANNLLAVSRHYVPEEILFADLLWPIFFAFVLWMPGLGRGGGGEGQVWGKDLSETSQICMQQRKAMRLITFSAFRAHASLLCHWA